MEKTECYLTIEKTMVLWKKLWYYGKNYDTISKTMELNDLLWKKLWHYGKNHGTIVNYIVNYNLFVC